MVELSLFMAYSVFNIVIFYLLFRSLYITILIMMLRHCVPCANLFVVAFDLSLLSTCSVIIYLFLIHFFYRSSLIKML